MGQLFVRFNELLTPVERERLAELKAKGIPQHIRDRVNEHSDEYWKNYELASYIASYLCYDAPLERQQLVTSLLEQNQKKSRRTKFVLRIFYFLLFCFVVYIIGNAMLWLSRWPI